MSKLSLEELKARATELGVKFHSSISAEKLAEKLDAAVKGDVTDEAPTKENTKPTRAELLAEATKLVRVNVSCMNPQKAEWDGEILTAGNSIVGTHRKFVKFNTEEGWHIPNILYKALKNRKFQTFYNKQTKNGVTMRASRLIPEFSIEVLDPLSQEELGELAKSQAARGE